MTRVSASAFRRPCARALPPPPDFSVSEWADENRMLPETSAARGGRSDLMLPEAAAFDAATGAWSDPDRYRAGRHRG